MRPAANTKGEVTAGNQPQDRLMKLEGVVEHMICENTETGYAVFEVDAGGHRRHRGRQCGQCG